MGSLGVPEIAFILVLALLIFGPKKLPEIGRTLGKGMAEFRKATNELKRSVNTELALDETPGPPQLHSRRLEMELPVLGAAGAVEPLPLTEARTASATFATQATSATSAPVPVAEPDIVPVAVPADLVDPHLGPH
ncbi:MAG TPA: twin-arginine translocase TatA/TatE family subunit [Thermoanaerobaculia bacterium]|jgi:sec-independent protein translocase protein TatA|nr:twin-arginine translocase TatA/TatE family subunit [Thermoanaerobaculia bacterium]